MAPSTSAPPEGTERGDFPELVRDALRHLHDYAYLQAHPLARYVREDREMEPWGAGRRLGQSLQDAVAALQPEHPSASSAPGQRRYRLLTLRYVDELEPPAVQQALAISRSTYQRELAAALEAIAALLRARWLGEDTGDSTPAIAPASRAPRGARLPMPLTSFIGRATELAAIEQLLTTARLVTLTGPPGAGKTRLALQVAALQQESFADGVRFVSLAARRDVGVVLPTIAQALEVRDLDGRPLLETLREALFGQRLLLVLDNFEHLLPAAPDIVALLRAVPRLTVLATSRAPLRVDGEHDFLVLPLTLPGRLDQASAVAGCAASEAVRLFVERARAAQADFALTPANAAAVAEICRRLDGLPLAIELAAARLRVVSVANLLARLEHRLPLLTGGPQDWPARQRTLRAAIDWSYDLLDPPLQALFRRVSAFVGGFTVEAVEAVAGASECAANLDGLGALVEQRLLQPAEQPIGDPRFAMLESIREYAWEQLAANGEAVELQRHHARYYLALAQRWGVDVLAGDSPEQRERIVRLETENDNLRASLRWFEGQAAVEEMLRLAGMLAWFWLARNRWTEGRQWLERALGLPGGEAYPEARALALQGAAVLSLARGDLTAAQGRFAETVAIQRALGNRRQLAAALGGLASAAARRHDPNARPLAIESLTLFRQLGDARAVAAVQLQLGAIAIAAGEYAEARQRLMEGRAYWQGIGDQAALSGVERRLGDLALAQGNHQEARAHYGRSIAIYRALRGEDSVARQGIAVALMRLGELADRDGDCRDAGADFAEALALARNLGDQDITAWALVGRGRVARRKGEEAGAMALFREALAVRRAQRHALGIAICLCELAEGAVAAGQPERAVRLFAAAEAWRPADQDPAAVGNLSDYPPSLLRQRLETLHEALGAIAFAAARDEGRTLPLEQIIADDGFADRADARQPEGARPAARAEGLPRQGDGSVAFPSPWSPS